MGRREFLSVFGGDFSTPDGTGVRDYIHVVSVLFWFIIYTPAVTPTLTPTSYPTPLPLPLPLSATPYHTPLPLPFYP